MRFKLSPLVSECDLFEIQKWTLRNSEVSAFLTLCGSSVSPSKSDCPLFEIQKVDTSKFGSVHFSDATLETKKWTVGISGVSTFLTLPVWEKTGQLSDSCDSEWFRMIPPYTLRWFRWFLCDSSLTGYITYRIKLESESRASQISRILQVSSFFLERIALCVLRYPLGIWVWTFWDSPDCPLFSFSGCAMW